MGHYSSPYSTRDWPLVTRGARGMDYSRRRRGAGRGVAGEGGGCRQDAEEAGELGVRRVEAIAASGLAREGRAHGCIKYLFTFKWRLPPYILKTESMFAQKEISRVVMACV